MAVLSEKQVLASLSMEGKFPQPLDLKRGMPSWDCEDEEVNLHFLSGLGSPRKRPFRVEEAWFDDFTVATELLERTRGK